MSLVPFKILVFAFLIIFILLFSTGIVAFQKEDYTCLGKYSYGFTDKTEIIHFGYLRVYAYPFQRVCPDDKQYQNGQVPE